MVCRRGAMEPPFPPGLARPSLVCEEAWHESADLAKRRVGAMAPPSHSRSQEPREGPGAKARIWWSPYTRESCMGSCA
jgi:hypothetical protein